jgi:hypothetical protein
MLGMRSVMGFKAAVLLTLAVLCGCDDKRYCVQYAPPREHLVVIGKIITTQSSSDCLVWGGPGKGRNW